MRNLFRRTLALVLSAAIMISCLVISAVFVASATGLDTSQITRKTYTFDTMDGITPEPQCTNTIETHNGALILRGDDDNNWNRTVGFDFPLSNGKTYVVSMVYKRDIAITSKMQLKHGYGNIAWYTSTVSTDSNGSGTWLPFQATEYTHYTTSFTVPDGTITSESNRYYWLKLNTASNAEGGADFYIDSLTIFEAGAAATIEFDAESDVLNSATSTTIVDGALKQTVSYSGHRSLAYQLLPDKTYNFEITYRTTGTIGEDIKLYSGDTGNYSSVLYTYGGSWDKLTATTSAVISGQFTTDSTTVTDTNKYLWIYVNNSLESGEEFYINSIRIYEDDGSASFDFSDTAHLELGQSTCVEIADQQLKFTTAQSWQQARAIVPYILENNKTYNISLKYRSGVDCSYDLRLYAGKNGLEANNSWTMFGGNSESEQRMYNVFSGQAVTASDSSAWQTIEFSITPTIISDTYKYLGFFVQPTTSAGEFYIDDIIITVDDGSGDDEEDSEETVDTNAYYDFSDSAHLDYGFSANITDEALVMSTGSYQQARARLPFVPQNGKTYKLTLDYKADFPDVVTSLSFTLALNYAADTDSWSLLGTEKKLIENGGTRITALVNSGFNGDTDWQTVTCYFTVPDQFPVNSDGTVTYDHLGFWMQPGATQAAVYIDNISIEKMDGSIAFDTGCDITIDDLLGTEGSIAQLPTLERLGYSFDGWYLDGGFANTADEVIFPAEGKVTTLYAKWTILPAAETPAAPEIEGIVNNRVILKATDGYEYSLDGENWQSISYFDGLFAGNEYTFYQRAAASYTSQTSAASETLTYTFSALGDTDANNAFTVNDLLNLRKYILGLTDSLYFEGCDINSDLTVNVKDLVRFKKIWVDYTEKMNGIAEIPHAGEYDFCDDAADENSCVTVTGIDTYLNVTSGTIWNGSSLNSTNEIRTNEYIFLPKGSTLSSDTSYKVYYYNADFAWKSDWYTGTTTSGSNPSAVTGTTTVNQDCFARLVSYSSDINLITVKVPKDRVNDFYIFDSESNAAFNYCVEKYITLSDYAKIVTEGSVNYMFITDLHCGSHTDAVKRQLNEMLAMIEKLNSDTDTANDIDFIALGGDITTGMYSSLDKLETAVNDMLEPLNDCNVPVMILRGNHDDNSYYYSFATIDGTVVKDTFTTAEEKQACIDETVMSEARWKSFMLDTYASDDNSKETKTYSRVHDSKNPDSAYYYYDFADKKTRVICLDSIDYGTATPSTLGTNWYGYGLGQLNWLITEAMTADSDWNYIFLSHMGYDVSIQTSDPIYHNLDLLQNIMLAFQNRTSYNSGKTYTYTDENGEDVTVAIACDYTALSADNGYILSYEFGHHHTDARYYDKEMNIANMNIGTSGQYTEGTEVTGTVGDLVSRTPIRASYTKSEALFDLVSVTNDTIYELRFGAGEDMVFTLK